MTKFLKLIQNEYIKTLKKTSTKVIFVLIFLSVFAIIGIAKWAEYEMQYYQDEYMDYMTDEIDYQSRIDELNETKEPGYQFDIEKLEFLNNNKIDSKSWRFLATEQLFEYETSYDENENVTVEYVYPEAERKMLEKFIVNNDWKNFCKSMVAVMKMIPGVTEDNYWEYEYRIKNDIPLPDSVEEQLDWRNQLIYEVKDYKENIANQQPTSSLQEMLPSGSATSDSGKEETPISAEANMKVALYRLENNIEVNVADNKEGFEALDVNFWSVCFASNSLIKIVGMLIIVITGGALANEFSSGTIKFLLINPVKRWKILLSKYIMSITFGYIIIFTMYILSILLSMLFFGTDMISAEYISYIDGKIVVTNGFFELFKTYMLSSINVVVMATLAFSISSLVRSASLAIGISLFSLLSGNVIISILKEGLAIDWTRYLLFANTDLAKIASGNSIYTNHSLTFAIGVIAVHLIVFFLIAWDGFTRREI